MWGGTVLTTFAATSEAVCPSEVRLTTESRLGLRAASSSLLSGSGRVFGFRIPLVMTYYATYVNHESLGERTSTLEGLRSLLGGFARNRVLQVCSVINTLLTAGKRQFDRNAHNALVANAFAPATAQKLLSLDPAKGVVFHRQQSTASLLRAGHSCVWCAKK